METEQSDHDLLLTMKAEFGTKLDRVISDVRELKDNVASRVTDLENEKLNVKDFDEFRKKVDPVINNFYKIIGGLILLNVIGVPLLIYFITKH